MITISQLRDFLGVDENEDEIITFAFNSALEELKRVTLVDWSAETDNAVAIEAIQSMVYRNYWGIRDSAKNLEFLNEHINQKIRLLKYSDGVV